MSWWKELGVDLAALGASVLLVAGYYALLRARVRRDPSYTIHSANEIARRLWVLDVMSSRGKDLMAIQTLRNFIMAAVFLASTASLLTMGTLTLSGQAESLARTWHALDLYGSRSTGIWTVKILCLLLAFIVAFFSFTLSVRLTNHVLFMINVPDSHAHRDLSPERVAERLNRAGTYFSIGMRAFFFAVPLVFWLFGPPLLLAATLGVVLSLFFLDRSSSAPLLSVKGQSASKPEVLAEFRSERRQGP
jgi:uncharacterized membrane protein